MKLKNLLLVLALSSLAACGDKGDEQRPTEKTSLMGKQDYAVDARVAEATPALSEKAQSEVVDTAKQGQEAATGSVAAAGEAGTASVASAAIDSRQVAAGKDIYSGKCMTCHAAGLAGFQPAFFLSAW